MLFLSSRHQALSFLSCHLTSLLAFFLKDAFLLFFLSIVPFKSHPFPVNTCPIHFFFLLRITSIGVLFSFTISNTWSFVTLSFQPILSILQSIDFIFPHCPRFRTIYNATVHTTALIIFFFNFLSILCVNSPLLLLARKSALLSLKQVKVDGPMHKRLVLRRLYYSLSGG